MNYQITQLTKDDYAEAIDFMNMVFSMNSDPHNFPELLPKLYKPTDKQMQYIHAIRIDGKIKALLGIYPSEMIIDGESIKFAEIGGVCTHPYMREQQLMSTLMKFAVTKLQQDGYDLAGLGGNRERYKYFGFEICGTKTGFWLSSNNFKHNKIPKENNLTLEVMETPDQDVISRLNAMYKQQVLHINRSDDEFLEICRSWKNKLYVARQNGEVVGYLVPYGSKSVAEVIAISDNMRLMILQEFFKDSVSINLNNSDIGFIRLLSNISENRWIDSSGSWQIFNHEKVLTALLKMKNRITKLATGEAVFEIERTGTFKIVINEKEISCQKTDLKTVNIFNREEFMRIALGSQPPSMTRELPPDLQIFDQWFPLPLSISSQDKA